MARIRAIKTQEGKGRQHKIQRSDLSLGCWAIPDRAKQEPYTETEEAETRELNQAGGMNPCQGQGESSWKWCQNLGSKGAKPNQEEQRQS